LAVDPSSMRDYRCALQTAGNTERYVNQRNVEDR